MQWQTEDILAQAVRQITLGQGGADVYELTGGRIAKIVCRSALERSEAWAQYLREAQFYAAQRGKALPFLPEVLCSEWDDEQIRIVMRKYAPLDRQALDEVLLEKIMAVLAQIHALPVEEETAAGPQLMDDDQIAQCAEGWHGVLAEHGDVFAENAVDAIAAQINEINQRNFSPRRCCSHGDFHFENLLQDEDGNIVVCDWQNVTAAHPAADIAFLLSRLSADGIAGIHSKAVESYCRFSPEGIAPEEINAQMSLANLNTSFGFWHYFLHGADLARVREIYDQMAADFAALTDHMAK